jgi:hypothetical protein
VPYLLCLAFLLASCLPKPLPALPEPTRRQQKLFQASFDEVWKAAHATVEESLMRITEDDEAQGTFQAAMHRNAQRTSPEGLEREVTRVAELHKARQRGLGRVAEYAVEYTVEVHPASDDRTGLDVSTAITATDYQIIIVPPGIAPCREASRFRPRACSSAASWSRSRRASF